MQNRPFAEIATGQQVRDPSNDWLRDHAERVVPRITRTKFDNFNYQATITARLSRSTFFIADRDIRQNSIGSEEAAIWARRQNDYIADKAVIVITGYIGPTKESRVGCQLIIEATQPNIAAMQKQLYFPPDDVWEPELTVIYTPGLLAPGKPDDRLITVDLDRGLTRVFGSDYFGESKMGGLRMWNHLVYQQGGLGLHAGLKVFPSSATPDGEDKAMLIVGLSGTGKTTTTFSRQLDSLPVQDDFVALMPGGTILTTENGCFAKTFGLTPEQEPAIYAGVAKPDAWLENVGVDGSGRVDFWDRSHTANGRATFPLGNIKHHPPDQVPPVSYILMLNRSQNIIPAVAKLRPDQVPAYFMLGETTGTSAGGTAEEGKSLRVPGTNPFFFDNDSLQGNRLMELLATTKREIGVYVLNTGRIGGADDDPRSKKVEIQTSSAILEGIVGESIDWEEDSDFHYLRAASIDGVEDLDLLAPEKLYIGQGRSDEYRAHVDRLTNERLQYLNSWSGLRPEIVAGL